MGEGEYYIKIKKINVNSNIFYNGFEIGILLKAIDRILLLFLNPNRLGNLVTFLTYHEI